MRQALPLIHCLSEDTRAKLLAMLDDPDSLPFPVWDDWKPEGKIFGVKVSQVILDDDVDYAKEMRKVPSPSSRSRK